MRKHFMRLFLLINIVSGSLVYGKMDASKDLWTAYDTLESQLRLSSIVSSYDDYKFTPMGYIQFFIPIAPIQETALDIWYGHLSGVYSKNKNFVEVGAGYRKQMSETFMLGGYSLIEYYYHIPSAQSGTWLLRPGIEVRGEILGFTAQGYVPLGKNENILSIIQPLNTKFKEHQEISTYYAQVESLPLGLDIIGSWSLNSPWTLSLGGYYLRYPESSQEVLGLLTEISYAPTPILSLEIKARYDQKNRFLLLAQLNFTFGKNHAYEYHSSLLYTPIPHSITPIEFQSRETEVKKVVKDRLYFYSPNASGTDCTYEHPCNTLIQNKIEAMPEGATLYLAPGEYEVKNVRSQGKKLNLHKNQSLFGRSADFLTRAIVDNDNPDRDQRPCIKAQLNIKGKGHKTKIEAVKFILDQNRARKPQSGLVISSAGNVYIDQVHIYNINRTNYPIEKAIVIENSTNIEINDSYFSTLAANQVGITVQNSENIQVQRSFIQAENTAINAARNSKNLRFKNNIFQHQYNAVPLDVKILDIHDTVKQFIAAENQFTFGTSTHNTIGMVGIDGKERIAHQNYFKIIKGLDISKIITKEPNGKVLTLGKTYRDNWQNTFVLDPS